MMDHEEVAKSERASVGHIKNHTGAKILAAGYTKGINLLAAICCLKICLFLYCLRHVCYERLFCIQMMSASDACL